MKRLTLDPGGRTFAFRKAAEEGRVLSAEVLGKLPVALHALYGDAASQAANSTPRSRC